MGGEGEEMQKALLFVGCWTDTLSEGESAWPTHGWLQKGKSALECA